MGASDAIKVLVDSLTDGSTVYAAGQVVFEPSEALQAVADSRRADSDGHLLAKRITKVEATKAARREDRGEAVQPLVTIPEPDPDEDDDDDDEAPSTGEIEEDD